MTIPGGIGPTGHQALERLQQTSEQAGTGPPTDGASNQAPFERALQEGAGTGTETNPADAGGGAPRSDQPSSADPQATEGASTGGVGAADPTNHGDRILAGLEKGRAQYRSVVDSADKTSEAAKSMSPDELLRAQLTVARVTLNESLAGQVGSKVDSDVQTLLKD